MHAATWKNISSTWLLDTVIGFCPWQKCILMSHFTLIASVAVLLSLLSGFLINNICTSLHFFNISTHGVRFVAQVPGYRAPTGGPSRRAVPVAGAGPSAICQSGWGTGTQTGEVQLARLLPALMCALFFHLHYHICIYAQYAYTIQLIYHLHVYRQHVASAAVVVTYIVIVPFQTTIHHNDFYFSSCVFKMLFGETTNQSPSAFKRGKETWSDCAASFHSEPHKFRTITDIVAGPVIQVFCVCLYDIVFTQK